jgi:hypothetical protein
MARRTHEARGHAVKLAPTWSGTFGPAMAGDVLLPGKGARIAPTTFAEWLTGQRQGRSLNGHAAAQPRSTSS